MHPQEIGHHLEATLLLVASVDLPVRLELGEQVGLLAHLADFHVRLGIVAEEKLLVLRVGVHPALERGILQKFKVGICAEILGLIAKQKLLEISIVEDVRIHAPARMRAFLVIAAETQRERAHQRDKLLRLQVGLLGEPADNQTASVRLGRVLNDVPLRANVMPAHSENHGRTATVLHGGVPSQLDQVRRAQHRRDVVAGVRDLLHLLHGEAELFALGDGELVLQRHRPRRTPKSHTRQQFVYKAISYIDDLCESVKLTWLFHLAQLEWHRTLQYASWLACKVYGRRDRRMVSSRYGLNSFFD